MKYRIGQVLYVLLNREMKICPVQVVEEITKKSMGGESTSYIVKTGNNKDVVPLADIGGQVFESIETLRKTLLEKVTKTIDGVISSTIRKSNEWYPNQVSNLDMNNEELVQPPMTVVDIGTEEDAVVTLPDGTIAKIKMSV